MNVSGEVVGKKKIILMNAHVPYLGRAIMSPNIVSNVKSAQHALVPLNLDEAVDH